MNLRNLARILLSSSIRKSLGRARQRARFFHAVSLFRLFGRVPLPRDANIDPFSSCDLRCPLCPTGQGVKRVGPSAMTLERFRDVIDKLPYVTSIALVTSGEPFLNKDFFSMVRHAKQKGLGVRTHSHFSHKRNDIFFKEIVVSGLDQLYLSIDGASQFTYVKYRIGGDFSLVLSNVVRLVEEKRRLNSKTPEIIWKYLVNKHNEEELPAARLKAKSLGVGFLVDTLTLQELSGEANEEQTEISKKAWLPKNPDYQQDNYRDHARNASTEVCPHLFLKPSISPGGTVFPCCHVQNLGVPWGDLNTHSFKEIWANNKYTAARRLFTSQGKSQEAPQPCSQCPFYPRERSRPRVRPTLNLDSRRLESIS